MSNFNLSHQKTGPKANLATTSPKKSARYENRLTNANFKKIERGTHDDMEQLHYDHAISLRRRIARLALRREDRRQKILVEYQYEGEALAQYTGTDRGNGHFELTADKGTGKASLHTFPGADLLVGNWHEGGNRGMWQIKLA